MIRIMKKLIIITAIFLGIIANVQSQRIFSLGGGYLTSSISTPGFLLEAEFEKVYSEKFSIPNQLHTGFYADREGNNVLFADLHRGYRLTFQNGLYLEQSFGIGMMLSFFKDYPYYESENGNAGFFPSGRGWDVIPSVTLGAGYNVAWKNGATGRFWCRPKTYWKITFDQPSQPKFALQLGYSHVIK